MGRLLGAVSHQDICSANLDDRCCGRESRWSYKSKNGKCQKLPNGYLWLRDALKTGLGDVSEKVGGEVIYIECQGPGARG